MALARLVRRHRHHGGFEGVEGDAGVAADGRRERFDRVVVHLDVEVAEAALGVFEGAPDQELGELRLRRAPSG